MISSPADLSTPTTPRAGTRKPATTKIHHGDCLQVLRSMPSASLDSVVTDPPYAIQAPPPKTSPAHNTEDGNDDPGPSSGGSADNTDPDPFNGSQEAELMGARMLGQHSTNYSEKATHSRGYADNDNKWFQQWCELWLSECLRVLKPGGHLIAFGGTRSAHRLFTAAEDVGFEIRDQLLWLYGTGAPKSLNVETAARTSVARAGTEGPFDERLAPFAGWWTGIKPAHEPILLARKPLEGRVIDNIAVHRVGALNVAGCMISPDSAATEQLTLEIDAAHTPAMGNAARTDRWPSNLFMDQAAAGFLDDVAAAPVSRYFWVAKPSSTERVQVDGVSHPTVKPLALMRQLVRLVTPPGGTVLDPFGGSGTTAEACLMEGMHSVIVEREADYIPLIQQRLDRRRDPVRAALAQPGSSDDLFALLNDQAPSVD